MSFILDALKKSETDRQQQGSAEFARVPGSSGPARAPRWLMVLGVLLAINLLVLLGLFFRPSTSPADRITVVSAESSVRPSQEISRPQAQQSPDDPGSADFAEQIAEARRHASTTADDDSARRAGRVAEAVAPPAARNEAPRPAVESLPTIYDVIADGSVVLPELHLDIHVYSDVPRERFVFINMSKQREKSQLGEGPVVEEITPDGVILAYRGKSFLLPRD